MMRYLSLFVLLSLATLSFGQGGDNNCAVEPPFVHGKLGDNWPLAGILNTTSPKFTLALKFKKTKYTGAYSYKSGKKYKIIVNSNSPGLKIKKMFITAFKLSGEDSCTLGVFKPGKNAKKPTILSEDCKTILNFESKRKNGSKRTVGKWKSPSSSGCSVIMRLTVIGSDNKIYEDQIEDIEATNTDNLRYNALTLVLNPK